MPIMRTKNIITLTDSYKMTHHQQYCDDTEVVYSYLECRKGAQFDQTVFVGLQYFIKEYLEGVVVTKEMIKEAEQLVAAHFIPEVFNKEMWQYIVDEHDGKLPVRIKAVPEGTSVPVSNVLMTVENTDPQCYALTNHLETLLTQVWHASTVASLSRNMKEIMKSFLDKTSDQTDSLMFQLHDFGMRGVSSMESAGVGGMGHLVNFLGTDTINAIEVARDYYNGNINNIAYSIPATEHSVMTAEGPEGEKNALKRMLDAYPTGIFSVVGDSYDIQKFLDVYICKNFKERILARDHETIPCKVVIRPDSLRSECDTPEEQMIWIANRLWKNFGGTVNSKGYKVLNPKIGMIWGDGIERDGIVKILQGIMEAGYSTENVVLGMGGGLLQKINRDTQRFAFKCSSQRRSGQWFDISKNPLDASKASKKGRLELIRNEAGELITIKEDELDGREGLLKTVFENGSLLKEYSFDEVRINAAIGD
ncbi:MAG: nicotinate phosphoribosyltransferase [Candidatus Electrothrix sp. AUS3]|nr:nicotinate phosphoribosyltransferase [Candidatus Electrothrix gigas]